MSHANEVTKRLLEDLELSRFWGAVSLKYEAGRVVHIRKEESIKPEELTLSGHPRSNNNGNAPQNSQHS